MTMPKHIVMIAGEESGDIHAATLARNLLKKNPDYQLTGIGGRHMEEAGVTLIDDLARFGVTGLVEVLRHAWTIKKAYAAIKTHLKAKPPDLLILIDYPGFNLRLARFAKLKLHLKILYYISPQIWAWKAKRIELIKKCVDHMAVILPFEKAIYQKAEVPVSFVGHPFVEKLALSADKNELREHLKLPKEKKIVALLPGSRRHEITQHLPIMIEVAKRLQAESSSLHFVLPIAKSLDPRWVESQLSSLNLSLTLIEAKAIEVMGASDAIMVASGTASLEAALLLKPMCILYKASALTYMVAMKVIRVKYLGLCNLLKNRMVVPELLQYDCTADEVYKVMHRLLTDEEYQKAMRLGLQGLKEELSPNKADCSLESLVERML